MSSEKPKVTDPGTITITIDKASLPIDTEERKQFEDELASFIADEIRYADPGFPLIDLTGSISVNSEFSKNNPAFDD